MSADNDLNELVTHVQVLELALRRTRALGRTEDADRLLKYFVKVEHELDQESKEIILAIRKNVVGCGISLTRDNLQLVWNQMKELDESGDLRIVLK